SSDDEMTAVPVRLGSEVQIGVPKRLFRLDPAGWRDYDVTANGERFLVAMNVPVSDADAISVTVNWPSLIRR
ncbi:MAG TPA: hypothetical protein VJA66_04230, partial [Thermoanaerobaculia bacterium]